MKVKDISSFFNKPSSSSRSQSPPNTPPPLVDVPSRRTTKKKKKIEEVTVSDEEDPLPRDVRDKKKSLDGGNKKRKARVLSDSEDDDGDFVDKTKKDKDVVKKMDDKKKDEDRKKVKKEQEEQKKKKSNVDPTDFFSKDKVKRDKVVIPDKKESEPTNPTKRERRDSPQKKAKRDESPEPSSSSTSKRDKSKSPVKPVKQEKRNESPNKSSPIKSSPKKSSPKKKEEATPPSRKHSSSSSRSNQKRKSIPFDDDDSLDSDEEEVDFNPKKKATSSAKKASSSANKSDNATKAKKKKSDKDEDKDKPPVDQAKRAFNYAKHLAHLNSVPRKLGEKRIPVGAPKCLDGLTFVITGTLESLEREACEDLVKKYGGRITGSVSGKTTHLIVGDDPGESKRKKAEQLNTRMINEDQLLEMIRSSNPDANNNNDEEFIEMMDLGGNDEEEQEKKPVVSPTKKHRKSSSKSPTKSTKNSKDKDEPSSSKEPTNIKKEKEEKAVQPTSSSSSNSSSIVRPPQPSSLMWVDKYRPKVMKTIVGQNKDGSNAKKLVRWLTNWFNHHGKAGAAKPKGAGGPFFKDPEGKTFKCALLSGPPGIGKTTTAHLACKEVGYDYFEMNASDTRSKKGLHEHVSDVLSNKTMFGGINDVTSKHVLIMDEVDGMSGNEDRGGVQELIALIKSSRVPIICICNDRNHTKIRSLANYCYDLRFTKPTLQELKGFIASVTFKENLKIDSLKVNQLCISTDFDVRQILHQLELCKESANSSAVDNAGMNPKKDLRFGPWDICRKVFSIPEHEKMNIHERTGLFFQDYNIGPLFIQENYARWNPARAKQNKYARLELIARSAASIAQGELTESMIRRTNNWGLLPVQGLFSSYIPGQLMESSITGGIEFPKWLGKNSTKNKHHRQLQSLHTHVHLEVSASLEALNMDYLPYLRRKICDELTSGDPVAAAKVMETHSLLRDDFESINELTIWPGMINPFEKVDSKLKASFTRLVNKEVLPYASGKLVSGGKKRAGGDDYGELEEEEEEVVEDPEEEEKPEKDSMIKLKKKPTKKSDKDDAGPSNKKSRKK